MQNNSWLLCPGNCASKIQMSKFTDLSNEEKVVKN